MVLKNAKLEAMGDDSQAQESPGKQIEESKASDNLSTSNKARYDEPVKV